MRGIVLQQRARTAHGTTLTEMLVALVVLSIGMISVAAMLNGGINSLARSLHRQRAAQLSSNLAEVLSGIHASASWPDVTPANHRCEIITCAPPELLAHALHDWQRQAARLLPNGRGAFEFMDEHGQGVMIKLEWRSRGGYPARFTTLIPVTTAAGPP